MTQRVKTVKFYSAPQSLASSGSVQELADITVYMPEDSRVVDFLYMSLTYDTAHTAASNISDTRVGYRIDGNVSLEALSSAISIVALGERVSGEVHNSFNYEMDSLNHGNYLEIGTTHTIRPRVVLNATTATTFYNIVVCVTITYLYEDTSTTHIKTVEIPVLGLPGGVPQTKPGTAQVTLPDLNVYCPEAGKVYRNVALVFRGNIQAVSTSFSVSFQLDALTAKVTSQYVQNLSSPIGEVTYVWNLTADSISLADTARELFIWSGIVGPCFVGSSVVLVVTYEFTPASSTRILNSISIPFVSKAGRGESPGLLRNSTLSEIEFLIPEANVTLANAAFFITYQLRQSGLSSFEYSTTMDESVWTKITWATASSMDGVVVHLQCDASFTLLGGYNVWKYKTLANHHASYINSPLELHNRLMLNYTSDKAAAGVGVHSKTVSLCVQSAVVVAGAASPLSCYISTARGNGFIIPETDYYLQSAAYELRWTFGDTSTIPYGTIRMEFNRSDSRDSPPNVGVETAFQIDTVNSEEVVTAIRSRIFNVAPYLRRFPSDLKRNVSNPKETTRDIRIRFTHADSSHTWTVFGVLMHYTYSGITYAVAGDVTGSSGGTVTLGLHRKDTGELLKTVTRTGDGSYSMVWYDKSTTLFVDGRETDVLVGRSGDSAAA